MPARRTLLDARGRAKAYRPLAAPERAAALRSGLAAYERGDYFEAHEVLEPAWMGAAEPAERELYQGLIKLSAAFVHAIRGNPRGVEKNLRGARERLARAQPAGRTLGIDTAATVAAIDVRLTTHPGVGDDVTPIEIVRTGRASTDRG